MTFWQCWKLPGRRPLLFMKRRLPALAIATAILSSSAFAQSIPLAIATPTATPGPQTEATQTVTGRIVRLDKKAETFAVQAPGSVKAVQLKAENIKVNQLRRGERVIVTYSQGTALTVQATRSTR